MARKPMNFSMDQPISEPSPVPRRTPVSAELRKTVGARVPASIYRQLKAHAALTGGKVQDLVEEAIREKLERLGKAAQK